MERKLEYDAYVTRAKQLLQTYWGGGAITAVEVAEALRKLEISELKLLQAWVPLGQTGSTTAARCARAREIISGVLLEKRS